jgi:hypothetical protein
LSFRLLLAALLLRVFVPAGYMLDLAAMADGGWIFAPCTSAWGSDWNVVDDRAAANTQAHHGHVHSSDGDSAEAHSSSTAEGALCVLTPAAPPASFAHVGTSERRADQRDHNAASQRLTVLLDLNRAPRGPPVIV